MFFNNFRRINCLQLILNFLKNDYIEKHPLVASWGECTTWFCRHRIHLHTTSGYLIDPIIIRYLWYIIIGVVLIDALTWLRRLLYIDRLSVLKNESSTWFPFSEESLKSKSPPTSTCLSVANPATMKVSCKSLKAIIVQFTVCFRTSKEKSLIWCRFLNLI